MTFLERVHLRNQFQQGFTLLIDAYMRIAPADTIFVEEAPEPLSDAMRILLCCARLVRDEMDEIDEQNANEIYEEMRKAQAQS